MNLRYRPTIDQDAGPSDHVILEHWTAFGGHQLALRVTTADVANPDVVAVQVRYGGGQAEVIVRADEQGSSEASGSSSADDQTASPVAGVTGKQQETEHCSSDEQVKLSVVDSHAHDVSSGTDETSSSEAEVRTHVAVDTNGQVLTAETKQGEIAADTPNEEQHGEKLPVAVAGDQAAEASTGQTETSSSSSQESEASGNLSASTPNQQVDAAKQQSGQNVTSDQEQQCFTPQTEKRPSKAIKVVAECHGNKSGLSDNVEEKPNTANVTLPPRKDTADVSKPQQRKELRIGRFDPPAVLDDNRLEELLRDMPDLTCLSIDWREDGRKLDIDIVSQYCRNLVELDLSRFRLDAWSLEQLCTACPGLEVVKLPRKSDDSRVEVLLRKLPKLRSLDLSHTNVTGQFLKESHGSLETLSLAGCKNLKFKEVGQDQPSESIPQTGRWRKVRELDLSSTEMASAADMANVLGHFPQLEQLSLAHCGKLQSNALHQVTQCQQLRNLDASHVGSIQAPDLFDILIRCPQLERLSVAGCSVIESSCLRQLDQRRATLRLRELKVSDVCGLATADLISILTSSPQLERLLASQLDGMDFTACLTQLCGCAELRELDVSRSGSLKDTETVVLREDYGGYGYDASGSYIDKHEFQRRNDELKLQEMNRRLIQPTVLTSLLSGCQKLERLALAGCHITESASLRQLAQCSKLRELDLSRVTTAVESDDKRARDLGDCQSDAAGLVLGLSGCPLLERLSVAGVKAPLEQLMPSTGLPNLKYLDASQTGLTNNSLRRLPRMCPGLETLNMQGCSSVSEDGLMSYLPRLQRLRSLDLRGVHGASDEVMEALKECRLIKLRLSCSWDSAGKKRIGLALGCRSLKVLGLETTSKDSAKLEDLIREQLPLHRVFVLCFKDWKSPGRQPGPLIVLKEDAVSWD